MSRKIYVTGYGIISSLGSNIQQNLDSMLGVRPGIAPLRHIESSFLGSLPVGEVRQSTGELFRLAGIPEEHGYSRNALLGIIAAREAFNPANHPLIPQLKTGLISATTVGGMDQCEFCYDDFLHNDSKNAYIDTYDCADSTEKIAAELGVYDFVTTISTACSSAANALMLGARMIRAGKLDRVVAGGCESLTLFHLNGFNALKILDKEPCKPFDRDRSGINLGEGAAYLVLESEESAAITGHKPYCELAGWGNSCEAYHQTASSPDGFGPYLAMKKALDVSGLAPSDIGYVNAHGTGTDSNDVSEGKAIGKLFGNRIPAVSSTKQFTGHTTSAAGSIEAILSVFALQRSVIWPNLNFRNKMEELSFTPVLNLLSDVSIRAVMSNSFGFGGNDTTLIFRHLEQP